ncbi:MAG: DNA repair exonuclease [Isosphaeraceae bacterium]
MFKFLHAADIHLDSPLLGLDRYEGAPVSECREAGRRALENLVRLAVEERVAFVLIVGDLYDGDWPDYNTGLFAKRRWLCSATRRSRSTRSGATATPRTGWTKDLRPLGNVHVLSGPEGRDDRPRRRRGRHPRAELPRSRRDRQPAAGLPGSAAGPVQHRPLHTGVEGREGHARYAPCALADLRHHQYDYWALGHIHKRETLIDADPIVAFPGNLQGRNIRETGPKGCLLVTVDDAGRATAETRWLDVLRWEVCKVDAAGAADGEDLLCRFRDRSA